MHISISIVLAFIIAWAFRKRGKPDPLGWWRVSACVVAAIVPHLDQLVYLINPAFALLYQHTFMWSVLLAPIFAFGLSHGFSVVSGGYLPESKHTCARFFVPIMATFTFSLFLAVLSENGIALLAPLWFERFSLNILHSFDVGLLIGLFVFALLATALGNFRTDIARLTLVFLVVYAGLVGTFKLKAHNVGNTYAQAMDVPVKEVYTLPQPLSPFYWRIIILTEDARLHETRISLKRDRLIPIRPDMNIIQKAKASYMPIHKAVWRIYNRYGLDNPEFLEQAWQSDISNKLHWLSRFAVYQKMHMYQGMNCAQLKDLRFDGVKSEYLGTYLLCLNTEQKSWQAYQAADDASFFRLDVIY